MALRTKKKKSFAIPKGIYDSILIGIYDLGTQENEMYGREQEKVLFVWELVDEGNGEPLTISKFYTNSHHEKSALRQDFVYAPLNIRQREENRKVSLREFLAWSVPFTLVASGVCYLLAC